MTTVDHTNKISIDEALFGNEVLTLSKFSSGLRFLYDTMIKFENDASQFIKSGGKEAAFSVGWTNDSSIIDNSLLIPLFHWFSISIINYTRLVGFLSGIASGAFSRQDLEDQTKFEFIKRHCGTYVDSISELCAVKVWRNKIAAHFAITDPRKNDETLHFWIFQL